MAEKRTRRRFTAEFKAQAVKRLLDGSKGLSEVATELARPLFSPKRRPGSIAANDTAKDLTRLTGVLVSPAGKNAIFAGSAGGKPIVIGEGERIGGYVISSI